MQLRATKLAAISSRGGSSIPANALYNRAGNVIYDRAASIIQTR